MRTPMRLDFFPLPLLTSIPPTAVVATSDIDTAKWRPQEQMPSSLSLQEKCVPDRIKQGQSAFLLYLQPFL